MTVTTKRIHDLTTAGTVDGTEEMPMWQAGASRKATIAAVFSDLGLSVSSLAAILASAVTTATKAPVRVAATGNVTLASAVENGDALDGVTLATGDRVLLPFQTTAADRGIYTVNASGAPTRAVDFDASAEVKGGCTVRVSEGTTFADRAFVLTTNDPITLGTTALTFALVPTGQELGYSESTAGKTVTNTGAVTADKVSGVALTIPGTGRPVEIQWGIGAVRNSVANNWTALGLIVNSVADDAMFVMNGSTAVGVSDQYTRRLVLTSGTSYTFELGMTVQGGTSVVGAGVRIWLSVTER